MGGTGRKPRASSPSSSKCKKCTSPPAFPSTRRATLTGKPRIPSFTLTSHTAGQNLMTKVTSHPPRNNPMTTSHSSTSAFDKLSVSPARAAADLESLASVMDFLTEVAPPTLTARQLLFFLAAAVHDLRGTPVTMSRIREIYEGLGRSIEKSKDMLLEPTKQYQDAVGWLSQEHDPDDRRVRYLRLTDKGFAILNGMIESART